MTKIIKEEQVRYYADFIKLFHYDDGIVSEYKRIAVDITKWFDPTKVIPGKLIGISYADKGGFYDHEHAYLYYNTQGDKKDIIRSYGGVITKITKSTVTIVKNITDEVVLENNIQVN